MKTSLMILATLLTLTTGLIAQQSFADADSPSSQISAETGKININTADAQTLSNTLKGIGLKKAEAIIDYRNTYGPFHDIQELAEVSGIGQSTLEKNAGMIAVK